MERWPRFLISRYSSLPAPLESPEDQRFKSTRRPRGRTLNGVGVSSFLLSYPRLRRQCERELRAATLASLKDSSFSTRGTVRNRRSGPGPRTDGPTTGAVAG